jgi:hypothetical protein
MSRGVDEESKSGLPHIPNEIWKTVFGFLPTAEVKRLRLLCRNWRDIGVDFLFEPFVFQRARHDLERLWYINEQAPSMLTHIKGVRFEIGSMALYQLAQNLAAKYVELRKKCRESLETRDPEQEKKDAISEYSSCNFEWDPRAF